MRKKTPHESLFIEFGAFKAGAVGRFAIVALTCIVLAGIVVTKALELW